MSTLKPVDANLTFNARSQTYQICDHEKHEDINIKVDFNLLNFIQSSTNQKLLKVLYQSSDGKQPSSEFKMNLVYYYIFIFLYFLSLAGFSVLQNNTNNLSSNHLTIHLSCLLILSILYISALTLIFTQPKLLLFSRHIFLLIIMLTNFYLILTDDRILYKITGEHQSSSPLPLTIGLICILPLSRFITFDHFFYTFILGTSSSLLFLSVHLSLSNSSIYSVYLEASTLILFSFIQIVECYRADLRLKQIFWRRERESVEESKKVIEKHPSIPVVNTEAEHLLKKCDEIAGNLKTVSRVVIYKDVKKTLKQSMRDLQSIKKKVARGGIDAFKFELSSSIDDEDRTFIAENFMSVGSVKSENRRKSSEINEKLTFPFSNYGINELESVLTSIGKNWDFDIFFVYDSTGHSLSLISLYLFHKWNINEVLSIPDSSSENYFHLLEKEYNNNPYHNACHASDVLHSLLYFLLNSQLIKFLNSLDLAAIIIASMGHDVGHPALTNRFLVNSKDPLAIKYNDNSVLENMHCSLTFEIMTRPGCNIFENLSYEEWVIIRKIIVSMIMETDMSKHFEILGRFRNRGILLNDLNINTLEDKCAILAMGLKCADIGHSAKDTKLHKKWTQLVTEEFFTQGDLEKMRKQPVSMYCDRGTTNVPKSQIGFIKNIALPLYEIWCRYIEVEQISEVVLGKLKKNLGYWEFAMRKREATLGFRSISENKPDIDLKRRNTQG